MPENSLRPDYLGIWYSGATSLSFSITAPVNPAATGSNVIGPVTPGTFTTFPVGLMQVGVRSTSVATPAPGNKKNIDISLSGPPPPASGPAPSPVAMRSGLWQITLAHTGGPAADWDAWLSIEHGDGFPTFALPDETGDPPARRGVNVVGEPGTSRNTITVANYNDGSGRLADSSSRGNPAPPPGTPPGELKPTLAAPGEGIAAPRSQNDPDRNSSCCNQKVVDKSGTSMAAPHVTGLVALMLQKKPDLTFLEIREMLQRSARLDGIPSGEVPPEVDATLHIRANHLWGSGKVDAAAALTRVPGPTPVGGGGGAGGGGRGGGGGGGGGRGGGGGGGGGRGGTGGGPHHVVLPEAEWGYTPHSIVSRMADWRTRVGPGRRAIIRLLSAR
jgi:hypothetical protein